MSSSTNFRIWCIGCPKVLPLHYYPPLYHHHFPTQAIAGDPWLTTMWVLSSPFARLVTLLDDLKKMLEPALNGMKRFFLDVQKRVCGGYSEKIERIKTLMIVAVQRDHV